MIHLDSADNGMALGNTYDATYPDLLQVYYPLKSEQPIMASEYYIGNDTDGYENLYVHKLKNIGGYQSSLNFDLTNLNYHDSVTYSLSSSSTTIGAPPVNSCVLTFSRSLTKSGLGAQLAISVDNDQPYVYIRKAISDGNGGSEWDENWKTLLDSSGGTLAQTATLQKPGAGTMWYRGRDVAMLKTTSNSAGDWNAIISSKGQNGTWDLGCIDSSTNQFSLVYILDSRYNAGTNGTDASWNFYSDGKFETQALKVRDESTFNGVVSFNSHIDWAVGTNIRCSGNGEWSFDVTSSTNSESDYWHVWSGNKTASILACYPSSQRVDIPVHLSVGGNNNASYGISTNSLISSGEIKATSANAFRLTYGDYGVILRNDGENFYFLVTNSGEAESGSWNSLRPFYFNLSTAIATFDSQVRARNLFTTAGGLALKYANPYIDFYTGNASSWVSHLYCDSEGVLRLNRNDGGAMQLIVSATGTNQPQVRTANGGMDVFLQASGSYNGGIYCNTTSKWIIYMNASGKTYIPQYTASDARLKNNIKPTEVNNALEQILAIKHKSFDWKSDKTHNDIGYIAQELELINPRMVIAPDEEKEITEYSVDMFYMNGIITKAIQELKQEKDKEIQELKDKIKELQQLLN